MDICVSRDDISGDIYGLIIYEVSFLGLLARAGRYLGVGDEVGGCRDALALEYFAYPNEPVDDEQGRRGPRVGGILHAMAHKSQAITATYLRAFPSPVSSIPSAGFPNQPA